MNPSDLREALARSQREARNRRYAAFDPQILLRLALVPEWTDELASTLGGARPLDELVDQLTDEDIIEQRTSVFSDGRRGRTFWLRPAERSDLVSYLRTGVTVDVHAGLTQLVHALERLPETDRPWLRPFLDISRVHRFDPSGLRLMSALNDLVEQGRLEQASVLAATVHAVGELVGGLLAEAAQRAE